MALSTIRRRRRAHRTSGPRVLALLGVAGALAAAINAVTKRRSASSGTSPGASSSTGASPDAAPRSDPGAPPSDESAVEVVEDTYTCECGQEYRVSGADRHRVYWLKDAEVSDPVLSQTCPNCDRPLPHDHPTAAA